MTKRLELTGKRFGRLRVLNFAVTQDGKSIWFCRCDCGNGLYTKGVYLTRGATRSCGCLAGANNKKHGGVGTPAYKSWAAMKTRCLDKNSHAYHRYGGRGIKIAARWMNFRVFLSDMGPRPAGTSLDRIDNDGDYKPSNCRWATSKQQASNTMRNRLIGYNGKTWNLKELAKEFKLKRTTLGRRLDAGWSIRDALTRPVGAKGGVT